jgi:hypothetical protein
MLDTRSVLRGVTPKTGDLPQWKMKKAQMKKARWAKALPAVYPLWAKSHGGRGQQQTPSRNPSTKAIENNKNNYFTYTPPTGTFVVLTGKIGQNAI